MDRLMDAPRYHALSAPQEPCDRLRDVLTSLLLLSNLDALQRVIEFKESLLLRLDGDVTALSAHPEDGVLKQVVISTTESGSPR